MPLYPIAIEDKYARGPEWEVVQPGYGQWPILRKIEWDPVHDKIQSSGPTVEIHLPDRPL